MPPVTARVVAVKGLVGLHHHERRVLQVLCIFTYNPQGRNTTFSKSPKLRWTTGECSSIRGDFSNSSYSHTF